MQTKSFLTQERLVIPVDGNNNSTFQNIENRKENFHGIRWSGRIITDDLVEGFSSGFLTLICVPTTATATPIIGGAAGLDDNQEFIIATKHWMVLNPAAGTKDNAHTFSGYDFDFEINTSRTCSRGGKIIAQIHNDSTSVNLVVYTMVFSTFRTIT